MANVNTTDCTSISPQCPVSATTYGYTPNLPANALLATIFGICGIYHILIGLKARSWTFMIALAIGSLMEMVGYIARIGMHNNVWDSGAFQQQIVCLIVAPSFVAAGIYWSLKHIVLHVGPEHSRLRPNLYPWVFIGCDIGSIILQAAGGGVAGSAGDENPDLLNVGNNIMIAGIAFQVGTMACKKRRVKCDESGNPCGNCTFRKVECTYANDTMTGGSFDSSQPIPDSSRASRNTEERHQSLPALNLSTRHLVELIHKFSTSTYESFSLDPASNDIWQVRVPELSLEYPFLLDGLLSVTALHTALTKEPHEALFYISIAMEYQSRSLEPFQDAIRNISLENCDAVFAHSIFTIVNGIVVPQLTPVTCASTRTEHSKTIDALLVVFELVQGTAEIRKSFGKGVNKTFPAPQDFWAGSSETLDEDTSEALRRLNDINHKENSAIPEKFQIIEAAISWLRKCFQRYHSRRDPVSVLSWLAMVDRHFVEFLRQHEVLPILILAHWGVLLARLDGKVWWALDSGSALVSDAFGLLKGGNDIHELESPVAWPVCKEILLRPSC
ncbi:hypothetical protein FE257_004244 [Aspergillus nanangensis]|uniref:Zn(2)-C6 fungal-type domain-containing protein n=1 Tax=Aspergillus nanangensis TaxID=2582783 RepID=A0AAD4GXB6_ASPNN|nr:hypothetical protein FE257_004244 [Aspergillus nanangensis]